MGNQDTAGPKKMYRVNYDSKIKRKADKRSERRRPVKIFLIYYDTVAYLIYKY